ncbi:ead/Ea22-like family protein [Salmonella enterica]|nr:ead/Ea22-like family protein [Salmonella enterica subsp. enterica serovar Javiana]EHT1247853.1 ead/Ea22-like family protein [Salmonella enterica]EID0529787.1 ead/Ea22-like family protein [Salmonella enterica]
MTALNKQALRKLAKALSGKEWVAFVHKASGTYAVGSLGHERGEDIIKWPGLDGQDNAENKAKFIAAANPATVLALLDELEKEKGYASTYEAEKWHYHGLAESEGERADRAEKALEAAEKRIAELQIARDKCFLSGLKTGWEYGIADDTEGYNREIDDAQAVIDRAAGIGVKGE